jgi:hypothetical protein
MHGGGAEPLNVDARMGEVRVGHKGGVLYGYGRGLSGQPSGAGNTSSTVRERQVVPDPRSGPTMRSRFNRSLLLP